MIKTLEAAAHLKKKIQSLHHCTLPGKVLSFSIHLFKYFTLSVSTKYYCTWTQRKSPVVLHKPNSKEPCDHWLTMLDNNEPSGEEHKRLTCPSLPQMLWTPLFTKQNGLLPQQTQSTKAPCRKQFNCALMNVFTCHMPLRVRNLLPFYVEVF